MAVALAGCAGVLQEDSTQSADSTTQNNSEVPSTQTARTTTQPQTATTADPADIDSDNDGLSDAREQALSTEPNNPDTDGDGLADGSEVNEYGTDPTVADTDEDGLADGSEVNEYGTDPTVADTDGDGLADKSETTEYNTNPGVNDTDGDGLDDSRELDLGTDPLESDTDGDGLPDGAEVDMTDRFPGADPLQKDIFVEVDYTSRLSRSAIRDITDEFEQAPINNPDGSSGVDIHIYHDDNIRCEEASGYIRDQIQYGCVNAGETLTSPDNAGYYYIQIVSTVERPGNAMSNGGLTVGSIAFVELSSDEVTGHIFMHELGHLLNIRDPGVDSRQRGYSEYRSVMNYLSPGDSLGYARSDWEDINQSVQRVPGTTEREIINQSDKRE